MADSRSGATIKLVLMCRRIERTTGWSSRGCSTFPVHVTSPRRARATPRETQQVFDRSLRLWADNEHRGCEGVFFGEHHFGGLNFNPSPHLLISALSQRTSHLRLGVMGSVLPLHDVRRLAEDAGCSTI